jgi:SAM-dependent methyltransferase
MDVVERNKECSWMLRTSLPQEVTRAIRKGDILAGDDYDERLLRQWYAQEMEAFYETNAVSAKEDPWYRYMRYVNNRLGFRVVDSSRTMISSVLVLGPGDGEEIQEFAADRPGCHITFIEASDRFCDILRERYPRSIVVRADPLGNIPCPSGSIDLMVAFSVLHHIPNVSRILEEVARVLRPKGWVLVREPCSSQGDWRFPRSATPNERGIPRKWMMQTAQRVGLRPARAPVPILFEPLNKLLKCSIGFDWVPFWLLYIVDRVVSALVAPNDHYWRDKWWKKIGPSSYFYIFCKA